MSETYLTATLVLRTCQTLCDHIVSTVAFYSEVTQNDPELKAFSDVKTTKHVEDAGEIYRRLIELSDNVRATQTKTTN